MRNKTILLFAAAAALAMGAKGGCGGGKDDGPKTFTMQSGLYEFTPTEYNPNTCWTPEQQFPPILPFQFQVTADGSGGWTLSPDGVAEGLFPEISGTVDGNALSAGPESYDLDATDEEEADPDYTGNPGEGDCFVHFSATADGTLTANDEFDASIELTVSDLNGNGCSELYGKQLDLGIPVPFPAIDGQECSLTPVGTAILQAQ